MTRIPYVTLDVFSEVALGGNQLAVIPDARAIPESMLLPITREFNFSETAFCYPAENPAHTAKVRIFTPGAEVPFAGHPTVGTAVALALAGATGETLVLEEGVGPVPVRVRAVADGRGHGQLSVAKLPEIGPPPPSRGVLAKILGLETDEILGGAKAPQALSCGVPFLLVALRDVAAVTRAKIRMERWEETLRTYWAPEIMVFALDPSQGESHLRARVFCPGLNVPEDPATGSANAVLAGWLAMRERTQNGTFRWTVDQGIEMLRPSRLELEADKRDGTVTGIRVGGWAVQVSEGTMTLPDPTVS
ncbi:MAG: PhzF family phenazine biosynthesis protein [Gemmatimonadaceae bacterium]|nr:PhzF family phenazine biosynthesis protein [Gemmatimonadaceae bacterium]